MVLGPPETVDERTVRVPTRVTSIISRWTSKTYTVCLASLQSGPDADASEGHRSNSASDGDAYKDITLIRGGSHEAFLYFTEDSGSGVARSIPEKPFTEMSYIDDTEELLVVDLTREVSVPPRLQFEGGSLGTLWDDPPVQGVGRRLSGSDWNIRPVPPRAGIGNTITVPDYGDYPRPGVRNGMLDLTALGSVEPYDERTVRVPVRITCRVGPEKHNFLSFPDLSVSTGPDTFGRLRCVWEAVTEYSARDNTFPDSFLGLPIVKGETYEAYAYFRKFLAKETLPPEPFTILWYGERGFEFPILLNSDVTN